MQRGAGTRYWGHSLPTKLKGGNDERERLCVGGMMTTKGECRDAKRHQREKGKRMRGEQWTRLWWLLRRNRYYKAGTLKGD